MLTFTTAALFTFCVTLLEAKQNASFRVAGPLRSFLYESLKNHKKMKVSGSGILTPTLSERKGGQADPRPYAYMTIVGSWKWDLFLCKLFVLYL